METVVERALVGSSDKYYDGWETKIQELKEKVVNAARLLNEAVKDPPNRRKLLRL